MQKIILSLAAVLLMTGCSMNNKNEVSENNAKNNITKVNNRPFRKQTEIQVSKQRKDSPVWLNPFQR